MARNFASGDYIEAPSNSVFDGSAGAISFWFKHSSVGSNIVPFGRCSSSSSNNGFNMILNNVSQNMTVQFKNGSGQVALLTGTGTYNDGKWHHAGLNINLGSGTTQTLYLDGSSNTSGTVSAAWAMTSQVIRMARSVDGFWTSFVGDMAEVAWWNQNLTADEFSALSKGILPFRVRPAALQLYLPLWN